MSERSKGEEQALSTESYRGVRDFYPEDEKVQQYIFSTMREVAESFGYRPYNASPLEPAELYEGKTSDEIVSEQTYTFVDRGGRRVTLRPEMTPTVSRMVAAKRKSIAFPLRLYSIPNMFRYERPQRGRLREHYQLNVDIFGVANLDAEIEVISLASALLKKLGLEEAQFEVRINDRQALRQAVSKFNLSVEKERELYQLLDKKDKIDNFDEELEGLLGVKKDIEIEQTEEVSSLIAELADRGITNVKFSPELVRGFDYYSGIIFEIFDTNPENRRSLFGGGRYDNLLEIFGVEPVPTVGFGMGDVTIRDVLESYDLLPKDPSFSDVYVCVLGKEVKGYADNVANILRGHELRVSVDMRYDSLGSQFKRAEAEGAKWSVLIGEDERTANVVTLKDMASGEQFILEILEVINKIKETN